MTRRRDIGHATGLETLGRILDRASPDQARPTPMPLPATTWRLAVGPRVAQHAFPLRLHQGTLTVRATSSAWAQELAMLAPTIQKRLQAQGFDVRGVRFSVRASGAPTFRPKEQPSDRVIPRVVEVSPAVQRALARIADPGLRDAIHQAARTCLGTQTEPPPSPPSQGGSRSTRSLRKLG